MTDDDELLGSNEVAPRHDPKPVVVHEATASCPECGDSFKGASRNQQLGYHRWRKHGIKGPQANKKKKAPVKRAAPKKTATEKLFAPVPASARRKPAHDVIQRMFGLAASVADEVDPVLGASLRFEQAAAGAAIDKAIAGTMVDRLVVQKMAGASEHYAALGSVLSFPVLMMLVTRFPNLFERLEPELREAVEDIMVASVPVVKARAEKAAKARDALQHYAALDPELANSADPVGELLRGMLPQYVWDESERRRLMSEMATEPESAGADAL